MQMTWGAVIQSLPFSWRLSLVGLYVVGTSAWAFGVVRPLPAGLRRFIAALPIVAGHVMVPAMMHPGQETFFVFTLSFALSSLSLFKVFPFFLSTSAFTFIRI
jgi:hypothetical protein